jgi:predicted transcriptional regulator
MYISKEQLENRLKGQSSLELKGRQGIGKHRELSREEKVLAGILAKVDTQANVAKALGTSQANVSNIVNGKGEKNAELQPSISAASKEVREAVSNKAIDILVKSLGVVEDKVHKESAIDASTVAKNMTAVIDRMNPNRGASEGFSPKILINIHGSKQKDEDAYETIDVEAVSA